MDKLRAPGLEMRGAAWDEQHQNVVITGDALVIDDWGLSPLKDQERRDLLEIVEDRHGVRSISAFTLAGSAHTAVTVPTVCRAAAGPCDVAEYRSTARSRPSR